MKLSAFYEEEKKKFLPIKTWKAKSSHCNPDTSEPIYYSVELWKHNSWNCNCLAGQMKRKCKHIQKCQDELAENKYNK